jgi:hypothetical protein
MPARFFMKEDRYLRFIFRKEQLPDWAVVLFCTLAGCLLIRHFYPYPAIVNDSYDYLSMAIKNEFYPLRPFGYSFFLRIVGLFSHKTGAILVSQGIVYVLSLGAFLLCIKKYWPPRHKWAYLILEAVVTLSPAALYLLNSVLSDALFCCLVFLLLTTAIVMLKEQSWVALGLYLAIFYAALWVRHSAEFFPLAFIPIFLVRGKPLMRVLSSVLTLAVLALFFVQMSNSMYKYTGYRQVSTGFEGWQLANNALHVLPYIPMPERDTSLADTTHQADTLHGEQLLDIEMPADEETAFIHQFLCSRYIGYIRHATDNGEHVSADMMWDPNGPLMQTLSVCSKAYEMKRIKVWVNLGTYSLKDYAIWLMLKYPKDFWSHYLWPNIKNAFYPYWPEACYTYIKVKPGNEKVVGWFDVPDDLTMEPRSERLSEVIQPVLSWIELFTWLVMAFAAAVLLLGGVRPDKETRQILWLLFLFGFFYYGTTVFASPVALRYWMPMHAVKLAFAWIALRPESWESLKARWRKVNWLNKTVSSGQLRTSALVFVSLPLLAFCLGFLRWYYALATAAILLLALYFSLRQGSNDSLKGARSFTWRTILIAFFVALVWSYFGGLNGYWYQTSDWDCRNAIYFDLIRYHWPVIYDQTGGALVYYIGHWLPPAAVAKVVLWLSGSADTALVAGRLLLWIWTSVGLTIVMLLLFQLLNAMSRKQKICALMLLVLFSGMDLLGALFKGTFNLMMLPIVKPSGPHLEWWMNFRYQFSSNTTLLYWVFNQTIVAWIITLLFLKEDRPQNYLFYGVACLFSAPFACVGLAVLMLVKAVTFCVNHVKEWGTVARSVFSPQNLLSLVILVPVVFYLLASNAVGGEAASYGGREGAAFFSKDYLNADLFLFLLLEVGVYLFLLISDHYKNPLYYALWASFIVFPYFHIGKSLDFCMRATIPALFVLMVYVGRFILAHFRERGIKKACSVALLVCLVIGTATPAVEVFRGFYHTGIHGKICLEDRSLMTFNSKESSYNFLTIHPEKHFFFKHLAKRVTNNTNESDYE